MNPRVITGIAGVLILGLGLAALLAPERVMGMLGFGIVNTAATAGVLGEVRATFGGVFAVMGVFTLLSVLDPGAHRGRLVLIGCMWLGAAAGRLLGVTVDGNPGLFGWLSVVFEAVLGGALLAATWLPAGDSSEPVPYTPAAPTPPSSSGSA
jgi:hypothetical protein